MKGLHVEGSSTGGSESISNSGGSSDIATTSSGGSQASGATSSSSERETDSVSSGSEVGVLGSSPQHHGHVALARCPTSDALPSLSAKDPRGKGIAAVAAGASPPRSIVPSSNGDSEEQGGANEQATGPSQRAGSNRRGCSEGSSGGSGSSSSSSDDEGEASDGSDMLQQGGGRGPERDESQPCPAKEKRDSKAAPPQAKAGAEQWVGVAPGRTVAQHQGSVSKKPLRMWKATVRLPHSLGGGSLLLGSRFQSARGAALAADRASLAVWGREGALQRGLLNSPLEVYGPQERQRFGPDLAAFLAQLRLQHSSYMPATERAAQAESALKSADGDALEIAEREAGAVGTVDETAHQQAARLPPAAYAQGEQPFLLPFNPYEPCGCCPACCQPWLKERCWQLPAVHARGPRKEFITWIDDPRAAAEAQRQLELSQQRELVKSVLAGTRGAFGRLGSKGTHKLEPVGKAAAAAAGVTLEELAAAAAARHGIAAEDAAGGQGEGETSAALAVGVYVRQVRVHPRPPSATEKVETAQGSKRQRVGGGRAARGEDQPAQAGSASGVGAGTGSAAASEPSAELPWPLQLPLPPPTRLEWVRPPPRQSKVEKRLLQSVVQLRARQARHAEALQEAVSALPAPAPLPARMGTAEAAAAASALAGDVGEGPAEAAAAKEGMGDLEGRELAQGKGGGGCKGSVANGGFGHGWGLLPCTPLDRLVAPQPQRRLLRQVDSEYHRGASTHELQQGAYGEAAVPACVHCGGRHPGMRGLLDCPVWQSANAVELPEPPPECPHCAQWEVPGCSRCLPEGAQLRAAVPNRKSSRYKRRKAGDERQAATQVAVPVRARAPWVARLPPHTLDTLHAAQAVADAACADLSMHEAAGRFTPKALLACVLLAEAAVEARLKQDSGEGPHLAVGI
ncbi:hypothetical protein N2152v2_009435 [Parachlorella kessleri]